MWLESAIGGIEITARTMCILGMARREKDSKGSPSTRKLPFFIAITKPGHSHPSNQLMKNMKKLIGLWTMVSYEMNYLTLLSCSTMQ